ncbi:MAG: hypothetical protein Q9O62_00925 [Ardenticatenia bacterium]|nr:hypothetical protein [Ardenticatenia bacterium]
MREHTLASGAHVLTSPVIHGGAVYVVQEDGTLNIIESAGVSGYGNAIWPRYRKDNRGSARRSAAVISSYRIYMPLTMR